MLKNVWDMLLPLLFGDAVRRNGESTSPFRNLGELGSLANDAYKNLLSSYNPQSYENFYNSSFVAPIKRTLQEEIIPQIKSQFLSGDEKGSSALNQALSQSIQQAAVRLGEGMMGGYNAYQNNGLQALSQLLQYARGATDRPPSGSLGGLVGGLLEGSRQGVNLLGQKAGGKMMDFLTQKLFGNG